MFFHSFPDLSSYFTNALSERHKSFILLFLIYCKYLMLEMSLNCFNNMIQIVNK